LCIESGISRKGQAGFVIKTNNDAGDIGGFLPCAYSERPANHEDLCKVSLDGRHSLLLAAAVSSRA